MKEIKKINHQNWLQIIIKILAILHYKLKILVKFKI